MSATTTAKLGLFDGMVYCVRAAEGDSRAHLVAMRADVPQDRGSRVSPLAVSQRVSARIAAEMTVCGKADWDSIRAMQEFADALRTYWSDETVDAEAQP